MRGPDGLRSTGPLLPTLLGALLLSTPAVAQEATPDERAERERARVGARTSCPEEVAWPELPHEAFDVYQVARFDSIGRQQVRLGATITDSVRRTDVTLPQYGHHFDRDRQSCRPVIIVQATTSAFGYVTLDGRQAGVTSAAYFELLGTDPLDGDRR